MSLVKSMRKNSNKIMVFLLIFIMVGFVLGASLRPIIEQFNRWFSSSKTVAVYGDNIKVDHIDTDNAQTELKILQELMAVDYLNRYMDKQGNRYTKDVLLSQVLFPDPRMAAQESSRLKYSAMSMRENGIQVSEEQIDSFFEQTEGRSDVRWILLKAEAQKAGITVPDKATKNLLRDMIHAFSRGSMNAANLVNSISQRYQKSPDEIVTIFSDLLSVSEYAKTILTSEDVTTAQVKSFIGLGGERIKADMVRFGVSPIEPNLPEPTDDEIAAQFEKYKDVTPGVYTKENPFGFGYKQPATVVLEYLIVKLDDIRKTIDAPTSQEMEDFYQNNLQAFTSEVPVDPNAPDGEKTSVTKDYSDVAVMIRKELIRQKTALKADNIMIKAVDSIDEKLVGIDIEKPTVEHYKKYAGDYNVAAKAIAEEYEIPVYTGKTGKLSAEMMFNDSNLRALQMQASKGGLNVSLDKIVFAIDELGKTKLGRFDPAKPKMWQNIGPIKAGYPEMVALVRIVQANKENVPENVELSYDVKSVILDKSKISTENIYAVKDDVIADLKAVAAVKIAKEQAQQFVRSLDTLEWDKAIKEFNKSLAGKEVPVGLISLRDQLEKPRVSLRNKKDFEIRTAGMNRGITHHRIRSIAADEILQEKLYDLIPADKKEAEDLRTIIESAPDRACFVVKDVSRSQVTIEDYDKSKSMVAYQLDSARSDALALTHFLPDNILKRMGFEWTEKESDSEEEKDGMNEEDENNNEDKDGEA